MALKAVAGSGSSGGSTTGSFEVQLSLAAGAVVNGNVYIAIGASFACTLTAIYGGCDSGSFDAEVQINGIACTGGAITVNGPLIDSTITAANSVVADDEVLIVITNSAGNPPNARLQLVYQRV